MHVDGGFESVSLSSLATPATARPPLQELSQERLNLLQQRVAATRTRKTVSKKANTSVRTPMPSFPTGDTLQQLSERLSPSHFTWAKTFVQKLKGSGLSGAHFGEIGPVQFYSEFSGSGCAESALMSVMDALGCKENLQVAYCADFDPQCRAVLSASCTSLRILEGARDVPVPSQILFCVLAQLSSNDVCVWRYLGLATSSCSPMH